MSDIFEVKWRQSSGEQGTTPQTQTYSIPTDNSIYELNPVNSNWGSKGCYAGALAQNGSLMGAGSTMKWDGWKEDRTQSDMRDFTISSYQNSSQQNLRFMVKFGGNGFSTRQNFKWTNIPEAVAGQIQSGYSNMTTTSNVREYNPYSRTETNISITGSANTPLALAPINNLKINQLIWQPIFYIAEVEYYDYENGCYKARDIVAPVAKTFAQIKPIDKTPAGADYDEDLWTKGWKEISPVNEGGRRFRFITGCLLVPYYGKASYTYDDENDAYVAGLNPDDGLVYGTRNIFGEMISDSGKYPVINTTNCNRPCLTVMSEVLDENTGAVIYSTPPGIMFANISSYTVETSQFTVRNYQLNAAHQLFTGSIYFTDFWFNNNDTYNQFFKSSADVYGDPTLTCPQIIGNVGGLISTLDNTYPTGTLYFLADGPIAYSTDRAGTRINPMTCSYFAGQSLWATIASLGCYVAADIETAQKAQVGAYVGNNNRVYLGEMSSSGITNGIMLQGDDIADAPQAAIDDIIEGTPYEPVSPEPPTPGGDDPDDPSRPKDDEGTIGFNSVLPIVGAATSFLTSYILNTQQVKSVGFNLWSKVNSNTEADARAMLSNFYRLNNSGDVNVDYGLTLAEIPDYFIGLRWFPFSLGNNVDKIATGEAAIRVGTGITPIGAGQQQTYTIQNSLCYLDGGTVSVPYTYESYLDLEPYTSASIYIPYCGTTTIQPSLIMGRQLSLHYSVSLLTGSICAIVMVSSSNGVSYPLCVMNGMVGFDIAISGNTQNAQIRNALTARDNYYMGQWQTISGGIANIGKTGAITGALGKFSGGYDAGLSRENIGYFFDDVNNLGLKNALSNAKEWNAGLYNSAISAAAGLSMGASIAKAVADPIGNKITYENQLPFTMGTQPLVVGSSSSMANLILPQTAFVQIRRKNRHELGQEAYGNTYGYESKNTKRIGELSGFIKCVNPKVSIAGALQSEVEEIYGLLSTGIYRN